MDIDWNKLRLFDQFKCFNFPFRLHNQGALQLKEMQNKIIPNGKLLYS